MTQLFADEPHDVYDKDGHQIAKYCPHCGRTLPLSEFYKARNGVKGPVYMRICRSCKKAQSREYSRQRALTKFEEKYGMPKIEVRPAPEDLV